jgi:hypothetical protein
MKTLIKLYVSIDKYLTDEVILVIGFFAVALGLTLRGLPV